MPAHRHPTLRPVAKQEGPRLILVSESSDDFAEAVYRLALPVNRVYRALSKQDARARAKAWRAKGIDTQILDDLEESTARLNAAIESVELSRNVS